MRAGDIFVLFCVMVTLSSLGAIAAKEVAYTVAKCVEHKEWCEVQAPLMYKIIYEGEK